VSTARRGKVATDSPELRRLRARIDLLDRKLVGLMNERAELTQAVGDEKARLGRPVRDAGREREVLLRVSIANEGPTPQADLLAIYRRLIAAARSLESKERERLRRDEPDPEGEPPSA
jgi:chorismate mutase / prephenate dehydratase